MSRSTESNPSYRQIATAVLADRYAPPAAVLAAWHFLYGWKPEAFVSMVNDAAAKP